MTAEVASRHAAVLRPEQMSSADDGEASPPPALPRALRRAWMTPPSEWLLRVCLQRVDPASGAARSMVARLRRQDVRLVPLLVGARPELRELVESLAFPTDHEPEVPL